MNISNNMNISAFLNVDLKPERIDDFRVTFNFSRNNMPMSVIAQKFLDYAERGLEFCRRNGLETDNYRVQIDDSTIEITQRGSGHAWKNRATWKSLDGYMKLIDQNGETVHGNGFHHLSLTELRDFASRYLNEFPPANNGGDGNNGPGSNVKEGPSFVNKSNINNCNPITNLQGVDNSKGDKVACSIKGKFPNWLVSSGEVRVFLDPSGKAMDKKAEFIEKVEKLLEMANTDRLENVYLSTCDDPGVYTMGVIRPDSSNFELLSSDETREILNEYLESISDGKVQVPDKDGGVTVEDLKSVLEALKEGDSGEQSNSHTPPSDSGNSSKNVCSSNNNNESCSIPESFPNWALPIERKVFVLLGSGEGKMDFIDRVATLSKMAKGCSLDKAKVFLSRGSFPSMYCMSVGSSKSFKEEEHLTDKETRDILNKYLKSISGGTVQVPDKDGGVTVEDLKSVLEALKEGDSGEDGHLPLYSGAITKPSIIFGNHVPENPQAGGEGPGLFGPRSEYEAELSNKEKGGVSKIYIKVKSNRYGHKVKFPINSDKEIIDHSGIWLTKEEQEVLRGIYDKKRVEKGREAGLTEEEKRVRDKVFSQINERIYDFDKKGYIDAFHGQYDKVRRLQKNLCKYKKVEVKVQSRLPLSQVKEIKETGTKIFDYMARFKFGAAKFVSGKKVVVWSDWNNNNIAKTYADAYRDLSAMADKWKEGYLLSSK